MTGEIVLLNLNREADMLPEQFKLAVKSAGFKTQAEFAEYIDMNVRTVNDWGSQTPKSGKLGPPVVIVRLLESMAQGGNKIALASATPSVAEAVGALSKSAADMVAQAERAGFPPETAAAALSLIGQMYEKAAREHPEQAHAKSA